MQAALLLVLLGSATAVQFRGEPKAPKRKLLSIRLANIDHESDDDSDITVNHLAKCGGRFVRDVLDHAIPGGGLKLEKESESLTEADKGHFTIGLVRNPFEYYVSLWAFTSGRSQKHSGFTSALTKDQKKTLLGQTKPFGETVGDKSRFHQFMKEVNSENLGVMSLRFHGSYLTNFGSGAAPKDFQKSTAMQKKVREHEKEIVEDLHNFSVENHPVSCWVHTESIADDLRGCLTGFEKQVGTGRVNWAAFDEAVADSKHNKAQHAKCSDMYDDETIEIVKKADKDMLRAFKYNDVCGAHN